jgi:RNA polymerase sigma-70 factor (ECF subfamily)
MPSPIGLRSSVSFDQLLTAAREGKREAQGRLLEAFRRPLLRLARKQLNFRVQAKGDEADVVQEVFLKALADIRGFSGCTPAQLMAWLRVIVTHTTTNFVRQFTTGKRQLGREKRQVSENVANDLRHAEPSASETAICREEVCRVQTFLERLPTHYAAVVRLRFDEGLSFQDIASKMGGTAEAARKACSRAVAELAEALS